MSPQLVVPGTPPEGVEGRQLVYCDSMHFCPHILVCALEVWLPSAVSSKFMFSQVGTTI